MTTMLDKMAEAIGSQMAEDDNDNIDIARAALQAIRVPDRQAVTLGMVAMMTDDLQPTRDEVAAGFTAMIDAILEGKA